LTDGQGIVASRIINKYPIAVGLIITNTQQGVFQIWQVPSFLGVVPLRIEVDKAEDQTVFIRLDQHSLWGSLD
jgi:hypothetical protein